MKSAKSHILFHQTDLLSKENRTKFTYLLNGYLIPITLIFTRVPSTLRALKIPSPLRLNFLEPTKWSGEIKEIYLSAVFSSIHIFSNLQF